MPHNEEFPSPEATMALLKGRRSIRQYTPDPVSDEVLEAGPTAGSRRIGLHIVAYS